MIRFNNGGILVQSLDELPKLDHANEVFCDFETTSGHPKVKAFRPYHGHRIAGICITADDVKDAWYVPIRCSHTQWNLPLEPTLAWLREVIGTCNDWINHEIKFDAHFGRQDGITFNGRLIDTLTLAKIIQSDRFTYSLDALSFEWLEHDITPLEKRLKAYLKSCHSQDYGDVPGDIIGEYGCQDVLTTRDLYRYCQRRRQEQTLSVWNTEIKLTPVLFDMEVAGMRVDPSQLMKKQFMTLYEMSKLEETLHKITGVPIRPHTNEDCYDVLCTHFGLPVLGRTDTDDPSFDKDTLTSYLAHPLVRDDPKLTDIVTKIQHYRKLHTLNSLFLEVYLNEHVDGLMHPSYNQVIRTGRMSCRRPNAQQLSLEAKALVLPYAGYDIVNYDYSQIEFRLIVHYIQDAAAIAAYAADPDTDFHQWVADMCGIARKPAKSVNFAIAFGGGKKKIVSMLASNMELVGNMVTQVDDLIASGKIQDSQRQEVFAFLCQQRGEQVYRQYHDTLPSLRRTSKRASTNLELRGFVFNAYGRQRHLPVKASYRAFNTVMQSCAADVMKERTVMIAPRYNSWTREHGIILTASVHDATLTNTPHELAQDTRVLRTFAEMLEDTAVKFRVPMRTSCGRSSKNWADAEAKANAVKFR